jgi:hypothetical protein
MSHQRAGCLLQTSLLATATSTAHQHKRRSTLATKLSTHLVLILRTKTSTARSSIQTKTAHGTASHISRILTKASATSYDGYQNIPVSCPNNTNPNYDYYNQNNNYNNTNYNYNGAMINITVDPRNWIYDTNRYNNTASIASPLSY